MPKRKLDDGLEEECWHGIQDPRARKKIQDRLAQRARRKRLAESQGQTSQTLDRKGRDTQSVVSAQAPVPSKAMMIQRKTWTSLPSTKNHVPTSATTITTNTTPNGTLSSSSSTTSKSPRLTTQKCTDMVRSELPVDHRYLPRPSLSVYAALYTNGLILNIPCVTSAISVSRLPPASSTPSSTPDARGDDLFVDESGSTCSVPPDLYPSPIQLSTVHYSFIDRFPFPRMRERMIVRSWEWSAEAFLADLFTVPSWEIREGGCAWVMGDWRVDGGWEEKWGFLF